MKKGPAVDGIQVVAGVVSTLIAFGVLFAVGIYWLIQQSIDGNQAASMLLTGILIFATIFVVLIVILALIFGISKIQQSAAHSNMELMKVNAIENQQIMNQVQKGLLLQAQTQRQLNAGESARLLNKNQPENENRFFGNGTTIIDQAFNDE